MSETQSAVRCTLEIQSGDHKRNKQNLAKKLLQLTGLAARRAATQLRRSTSLVRRSAKRLLQGALLQARRSREPLCALYACTCAHKHFQGALDTSVCNANT